MAFLSVPLFFTAVLTVRYVRRRRQSRSIGGESSPTQDKLDSRVVSATIVLSELPPALLEKTLGSLPIEISRAIILMLPELPPIADTTIEQQKQRWLSHFKPPRQDFSSLEFEQPEALAAATVRLILEDSL